MAYSEHKNTGRCLGKVLYQLSKLGIPLHTIETVQLVEPGRLTYRGEHFATYSWNSDDVPIFEFKLEVYNKIQREHHV